MTTKKTTQSRARGATAVIVETLVVLATSYVLWRAVIVMGAGGGS